MLMGSRAEFTRVCNGEYLPCQGQDDPEPEYPVLQGDSRHGAILHDSHSETTPPFQKHFPDRRYDCLLLWSAQVIYHGRNFRIMETPMYEPTAALAALDTNILPISADQHAAPA